MFATVYDRKLIRNNRKGSEFFFFFGNSASNSTGWQIGVLPNPAGDRTANMVKFGP